MTVHTQIHRSRMLRSDDGDKSFLRRNADTMSIRVAQRDNFGRSPLPNTAGIVEAMLIAFINDIFAAFVAKDRRGHAHARDGQEFPTLASEDGSDMCSGRRRE